MNLAPRQSFNLRMFHSFLHDVLFRPSRSCVGLNPVIPPVVAVLVPFSIGRRSERCRRSLGLAASYRLASSRHIWCKFCPTGGSTVESYVNSRGPSLQSSHINNKHQHPRNETLPKKGSEATIIHGPRQGENSKWQSLNKAQRQSRKVLNTDVLDMVLRIVAYDKTLR